MTNGVFVFAIMLLTALTSVEAVPATTRRPHRCPICTQADKILCKPLPYDCEAIPEPNCGCCKMCAKKEGEKCGVATGTCESGLECIPPPLSPEDYRDYGPANYFMEAFLGNFVCVTKQTFLDILTGDAYFDDASAHFGDDNLYIPDLEALSILEELSDHHTSDYYNTDMPTEEMLLGETTQRPSSPSASEYVHKEKPCKVHDDIVWKKPHFDHHEWIPSCTHDGLYMAEQCEVSYGLERGRCWCVDKLGRPLTGFTDGEKANPSMCYDNENQ